MKKNFKKIMVGNLLFFPMTWATAAVWHPLNIKQELPPNTIVEATAEQELQPQKIISRQEIKANDFIQNNRTQEQINKEVVPSKISSSISLGMITGGQAKESVYIPELGDNLSVLNWDIKNNPTIKAEFTWNIFPWLAFNINGWTTFNSNRSTMNDYDWLDFDDRSNTTDWSHHGNTRLNSANHVDLNMTAWVLEKPQYKVGVMAGYQEEHFSWSAKGGEAQYSIQDEQGNYIPGTSQTFIGKFNDDLTVGGYKQKFKTPYIGLVGQYQHGNFVLNTNFKYSQWSKASTQDQHYLRELTGHGNASGGDYFSANINAGYYIIPFTKIFTEVNWTQYKRNLGQTSRTQNGTTTYIDQNIVQEGIANHYVGINAGLQYEF